VPTPATRCPPRLKRRVRTPALEGGTMGEKLPRILPKVATSTSLLGSLTCRKLRHGTDGFTSPPKEGGLTIFSPEKSNGFSQGNSLLIGQIYINLGLHVSTLVKSSSGPRTRPNSIEPQRHERKHNLLPPQLPRGSTTSSVYTQSTTTTLVLSS